MFRAFTLLILFTTLACSSLVEPEVGSWGGSEVSLSLSEDGGALQYQCGNGTIDAGWTMTDDGTFAATGNHFFGGGPIPATGRTPNPATYQGLVRGDELTLTVSILEQATTLGPFLLVRNGPAVQELCF